MKVKALINGVPVRTDKGLIGGTTVVLFHGKKNLLYDVGHFGTRHMLSAALREEGLAPEDIDSVVISHLHWDHCLNLEAFSHAEIIISKKELEQAQNPKTRDSATPEFAIRMLDGYRLKVIEEETVTEDGVHILLTPGHTSGFIAACAVDDDGITHVVTGDALPHSSNAAYMKNERDWYSKEESQKSLERLLGIDENAIFYPAHDRPFIMKHGIPEYLEPYSITIRTRFDSSGKYHGITIEAPFESEIGWSGKR